MINRLLRKSLPNQFARRAALATMLLAVPFALMVGGAPQAHAQTPDRDIASSDARSAIGLIYHRFGENEYPTTNIRLEQFEAHIAELSKSRYNVVTLSVITQALEANRDLPPRTVALTIDDAFLSVYREAWPRLKAAGLPFTLFVSTQAVDDGIPGYMTWDQIRELQTAGVEIGNHTVSHAHMPTLSNVRNRREVMRAKERLSEELGQAPTLFAYPYGEASNALKDIAKEAGYSAAFGQHSGGISPHGDRYYLPRFPVNESFGGIERFTRVINMLPLHATDVTPDNPNLGAPEMENPPAFGFTLAADVAWDADIACYHSDTGKVAQMERLGPRLELRFDKPFPTGRTRINCTVPTPEGRWRWFGMQYYLAP